MSDKELVHPPSRQLSVFALVRNKAGEVLLLDRKGRSASPDRWGLPGGIPGAGEKAPFACQQLVQAATGLVTTPSRPLVVHQMPAGGEAPEEWSHVFDAQAEISGEEITVSGQFAGYRWVHPVYVSGLVPPYMSWRIRCALDVLDRGAPVRFLYGNPDLESWEELAA